MIRNNKALPRIALVALACIASTAGAQQANDPGINYHIEDLLRADGIVVDEVEILTRGIMLDAYERMAFEPIWTRPDRIDEVIALIRDSENHGLMPEDYNLAALETVLDELGRTNPGPRRLAEADVLLTESIFRYAYHRRFGKVEGSQIDSNINFRRETFLNQNPSDNIELAIRSASLTEFVELIAPVGPIYSQLQGHLQAHRELAAAGGWPGVSSGPTLRLGDDSPRVAELRARLSVTGELPAGADTGSTAFDETLEAAVIAFQERHSLDTDGAVGPQTLAAINVTVETRIDQLRLSLERLRWVNQEDTDRLVAVNIAGFRVFYFEGGEIVWHTRAMVGREYRETPVFRGDIAYLEFNPTWTIPPGILRNDTLPAIKRDPNYLTERNIRVINREGQFVDPATVDWNQYTTSVPYTLRQDPGPNNALGIVKFIFPNEHFVFLHDTPNRTLFAEAQRAFSSGCIRVENPLSLAELVLDDSDNYSLSQLESIIDSRETRRIFPATNVPVLIAYLTASVDPDGSVRFYNDIYGRDQAVLDALNGPVVIGGVGR